MSKRTSQIICAGQLKGAKLKIKAVKNDGLQEYATIINRGTVAQPMSGWVLASLRGQTFYLFPDDLMFEPGMIVKVQSGQQEPKNTNNDWGIWKKLLWTIDQVWNNHSDTAILFDAHGLEIDRHSYPHERVVGSSANHRKVLIRNDDGFEIVNESLRRAKKATRKQSGVLADQPSND
ncbi:MAG: lamin tail domain-containing protein [Chloroflexi bacterium]|nr:lamin tail domain-containing protein [Chloroflexota bacterium]